MGCGLTPGGIGSPTAACTSAGVAAAFTSLMISLMV
jgi:hypothetical protein